MSLRKIITNTVLAAGLAAIAAAPFLRSVHIEHKIERTNPAISIGGIFENKGMFLELSLIDQYGTFGGEIGDEYHFFGPSLRNPNPEDFSVFRLSSSEATKVDLKIIYIPEGYNVVNADGKVIFTYKRPIYHINW